MHARIISIALLAAAVAVAQIPAYYPMTVAGTNGASTVFSSTERPFVPDRIVYADAMPSNGTLRVERLSGDIVELVAEGATDGTDGTGVIAATNGVVLHPGDTLYVNRGSGGTATNAAIQVHGQQHRRFP